MERNYNFDWNYDIEKVPDTERVMAQKIINNHLIKDVFEQNGYIQIEYTFYCKQTFADQKPYAMDTTKVIKIPMKMSNNLGVKCGKSKENNCFGKVCVLIVAAYMFYAKRRNDYYSNIIDDVDIWGDDEIEEDKNDDVYDNLTEESILNILTEEERKKYAKLVTAINDDDLLSLKIKQSLFRLIRNLINYNKLKNVITTRPNYNFSISENTDTVNNICLGQLKCVNTIKLILKTFEIIKDNPKIKYVNFRELSIRDSLLNPQNYDADIIIFTNIYYLTHKNLIRGGETIQENSMNIKNNIGSYIIEHSSNKIFIICDKEINLKEFFASNQQLSFQFQKIQIKDLKKDQIKTIFLNKLHKHKEIKIEPKFEEKLDKYIEINYTYSPYKNLEFIEFIFDNAIKKMIGRSTDLILKVSDLPTFKDDSVDEYSDLDSLVGLASVKKVINDLQVYLAFKKEKEKLGDKMPTAALHMVFYGNPGTGKTTVARLMAGILFNLEYIRYNKCIECESKDLIANIPGETALKTSEKIQEAMGGILFVDEAYAIGDSPYGAECIATLIKAMEDYRDDLIVILAGYRVEMMKFLEINSGFKSRISYELEFTDYDNDELLKMTEDLFTKYNVKAEDYDVLSRIETIYDNEKRKGQKTFGNSRFVRTTVEKILRVHAVNVQNIGISENVSDEQLDRRRHLITIDDIKID